MSTDTAVNATPSEAIHLAGEKLAFAAQTLKLIASPAKLAILQHLHQHGETSVTELVEVTSLPQPLLSHHLANLKAGFVVDNRREGKNILYRLALPAVVHVLECMVNCEIPAGFGQSASE
jgi:ArsR family transcriptional regulator